MSESSSKLAAAEVLSAIVGLFGLMAAGGAKLVGWLVHSTKRRDALAEHRRQISAQFDRLERWMTRVDEHIARSTEHRIACERFMARTDTALQALSRRIARLERMQDHAA